MGRRVEAPQWGLSEGLRTAAEIQAASVKVAGPLHSLLPEGVAPGSTVAVAGSIGLAMTLVASLAGEERWVAGVAWGPLGLVAARELGLRWDRLILVRPSDQESWPTATAVVLDAFDIVVVRPGRSNERDVRRVMARARDRGAVLVAVETVNDSREWWAMADVRVRVTGRRWDGLGDGSGHLRRRLLMVEATGRGRLARARRLELWLPGVDGRAAETASAPLLGVDDSDRRELAVS